MRYRSLLIFTIIAILAPEPAYAQSSWDSQPSWQDRQEQQRLEDLENERQQLEMENRRLRALREQESNERERSRTQSFGGSGDRSYGESRRAPPGYR